MNFNLFIYISILFSCFCFSQKQTEDQLFLSPNIENLVLNLNNVFIVKLRTNNSRQIKIVSKSEGEYSNHFVISKKINDKSILISGDIGFSYPNLEDKLSAHKVHSVEVEIFLPSYLTTSVYTDIGNVFVEGFYIYLSINSLSGNCYLENINGKIAVNTVSGDIDLIAKRGNINAISSYGLINREEIPLGNSSFNIKTAKGNINIVKSE